MHDTFSPLVLELGVFVGVAKYGDILADFGRFDFGGSGVSGVSSGRDRLAGFTLWRDLVYGSLRLIGKEAIEDLGRRAVTIAAERRLRIGEGVSGSEGAEESSLSDVGVAGKMLEALVSLKCDVMMGSMSLRGSTTLDPLEAPITVVVFEEAGAILTAC